MLSCHSGVFTSARTARTAGLNLRNENVNLDFSGEFDAVRCIKNPINGTAALRITRFDTEKNPQTMLQSKKVFEL